MKIQSSPTFQQNNKEKKSQENLGTDPNFKRIIVWKNVIIFSVLHMLGFHGIWYLLNFQIKLTTILFTLIYGIYTSICITGGAHRLWTHRAYQAKLPFKLFLLIGQTAALQNDVYEWCRDHRVHHKFTDTDADPHNSRRGFFFCHMGWLMSKKHPLVIEKGKTIDMSDLANDPLIMFQRKHYVLLALFLNQIFPIFIPCYFFGQHWYISLTASVARYLLSLHGTWSVNSAAHLWGMKPYDKNINPTESPFVIGLGLGEGFHNYHHTFPWDYKAAELGQYGTNWTTCLIDNMAKIGWATDLKTASLDMIEKRALRTGDGSRFENGKELLQNGDSSIDEELIWGWGDKDMKEEEMNMIQRESRA